MSCRVSGVIEGIWSKQMDEETINATIFATQSTTTNAIQKKGFTWYGKKDNVKCS